jgi:hypothetical protein
MPGRFDRFIERFDDILSVKIELAILVHPSVKVLAESFTGDGHVVALDKVVLQKVVQDLCIAIDEEMDGSAVKELTRNTAEPVDILHDIFTTWFNVSEEGYAI